MCACVPSVSERRASGSVSLILTQRPVSCLSVVISLSLLAIDANTSRHINTHHTLTLYAKPDKSRTIGTKCLSESLLRVRTKTRASLIVFLSPPCAVTHLGRQDDIMTIAGRHAGLCLGYINVSFFSFIL